MKGVHLDGPFIRDHCIPCLVGKSPQRSYSSQGHRAANIGELLYMDLCGPFPVQAPHGEKYFFNILDDKTNWGFTSGLRLKSDTFSFYLKTEAFFGTIFGCYGINGSLWGRIGTHCRENGISLRFKGYNNTMYCHLCTSTKREERMLH